ncbi:sulfotransferase family protein (plasmid) [Streptomyces sp. NBC_00704]|uniref:sulfotransferase family protein n=1 Tax=Streptomyces sp. NBC_00704 TaxID=2975809 RepID=UPI002E2F1A07|nr:sulfotransferase family protein [Streptomyces sp. NBC_00704]
MLKLINAGLGRTGTTSLKAALDRLGLGPSFHMFDIVGDAGRLRQWEKIVCDGERPDWAAAFDGYRSAVDGPCAVYYRQISEAFPDAKVLLTVRDADSWYRSTHDTLYQFALRSAANPPEPGSAQARLFRVTSALVWDGLFGGRFSDKDHAVEVYHRHNEEVVRVMGADNVLVYDVREGWEPLCAFLGVDVPREEFPRTNDTASMRQRIAAAAGAAAATG